MRGEGDDNVGVGDALGRPAPIAVRLHGHEDRLGATGREGATAGPGPAVHAKHHRHHLRIHLSRRRVERGVERVEEGEPAVRPADKVHVLVLAVVDCAGDSARRPLPRVNLVPLIQQPRQLVHRNTGGGKRLAGHGQVLEEHLLQVGAHLGLARLKLPPHWRKKFDVGERLVQKPVGEATSARDLAQRQQGAGEGQHAEDELHHRPLVEPPQVTHDQRTHRVVQLEQNPAR
mmetsp:Transcript_11427/g.37783  ORF Transcript_11427/g.37783 Transcript_11427/m.37783 type:complete len:231 (-) Transcript_11427:425-1117(-)|eukprot:scaffold830_cov112-Isochrysis_galbana.AAC.8